MNRHQLLEHTADMGVAAQADTLGELFRQMALGVRQIITECPDIGPVFSMPVEVSGKDCEELLVNWLSELIFLLESRHFLLADIEIEFIDEHTLRARVQGDNFDPDRHYLEREVKAVTYHQIRVKKNSAGWAAQVYVDL